MKPKRLEFPDFIYRSPIDEYMSADKWAKQVSQTVHQVRPRLSRYFRKGFLLTKKDAGKNLYMLSKSVRDKIIADSGKDKFRAKEQLIIAVDLSVTDKIINKFLGIK